MLKFNVLSRCSEPVKFAVCYVLSELMHYGLDLALLVFYGLGCVALGATLFLLCSYILFYESKVNA